MPVQTSSVAFPQDVNSVVRGLPERVDEFLRLVTSQHGGGPSVQDLAAVDAQVQRLLTHFTSWRYNNSNQAATLLSAQEGAVGVALLRLLAAATRVDLTTIQRQAGGTSSQRASTACGSSILLTQRWLALGGSVAGILREIFATPNLNIAARRSFLCKLLATQTLQACARQLAAAADLLDQPPQPPSPGVLDLAPKVLSLAVGIIDVLAWAEMNNSRNVETELVAALRVSHILEHAARLLLRLPHDANVQQAAVSLMWAYGSLTHGAFGRVLSPTPEQVQLARAASGPCADFVFMALGLTALCDVDGGPWYGLPEELRERLAPFTSRNMMTTTYGLTALPALSFFLEALLAATRLGTEARRVPLRAGVTVLMRLCRLTVASVQADGALPDGGLAGQAAVGDGGGEAAAAAAATADGAQRDLPLLPYNAADLAVGCLVAVRDLLEDRAAAWADVVGEWWRLAVGLYRPGRGVQLLSEMLAWPVAMQLPQDDVMAPAPSPDLTAALAAGIIPALERVFRRTGADLQGRETFVLDGLAAALHKHKLRDARGPFLLPLLAHGDPRQAAALVATFGKFLRRAGAEGEKGCVLIQFFLMEALEHVERGGEADAEEEEEEAGAALPPPELPAQLRPLLGCMLREWLPLCCRPDWDWGRARAGFLTGLSVEVAIRRSVVLAAAAWCHRSGGAGTSASGGIGGIGTSASGTGTAGSDASGTAAGSGEGGGWAQLLPGAVTLLGSVLRRADALGYLNPMGASTLSQACIVVAVACPDVLRAATRNAAAASAASGVGSMDLPWPPAQLRRLVPVLQQAGGVAMSFAAATQMLARLVELWATTSRRGSQRAAEEPAAAGRLLDRLRPLGEILMGALARKAQLLGPPVPASTLLGRPACANPHCASLQGDSELDLRLQKCGRCGAVEYCCRECQAAHWRAGHKAECGRLRTSGGAGQKAA